MKPTRPLAWLTVVFSVTLVQLFFWTDKLPLCGGGLSFLQVLSFWREEGRSGKKVDFPIHFRFYWPWQS